MLHSLAFQMPGLGEWIVIGAIGLLLFGKRLPEVGKSLGKGIPTGGLRVQRKVSGGLKAVTQSAKGLQEIFIRTEAGTEDAIAEAILKLA